MTRVHRQCFLVARNGFGVAIECSQDRAAIAQGIDIIGSCREDPIVTYQCFRSSIELNQDVAPILKRIEVAGGGCQDSIEIGERVLIACTARQQGPAVEAGRRQVGATRKYLAILPNRIVNAIEPGQDDGTIARCLHVVRQEHQDAVAGRKRLSRTIEREQCASQQRERLDGARLKLQCARSEPISLGGVALLVIGER